MPDQSVRRQRGALKEGELHLLLEVLGKINSGLVTEEILDHIYESFRTIIPYDRIGFALVEPEGRTVRSIWARAEYDHLELPPGYAAALEGSSLQRLLAAGEPRILNDLESYLHEHPTSGSTAKIVREGIRSSLTCPLIVENRPIGFLFFSSKEIGAYADAHVELYQVIASHVAIIVDKGRLHQELLEAKHTLEGLANVDSLTGAYNRRFFDELYAREWNRALRESEPLSVILVDIDFFKQFNDLYGHLAGDDCLKKVAGIISGNTQRGTDLVARFGGEEFVLVLPNTDGAGAAIMAERLRRLVEEMEIPHSGSQGIGRVTISLGLAGGVPRRGDSAKELLDAADRALYRAKEAGRNRVESG